MRSAFSQLRRWDAFVFRKGFIYKDNQINIFYLVRYIHASAQSSENIIVQIKESEKIF